MERHTWKAVLKPGMRDEYKRRHDEIWPEMVAVLKEAGIQNYTIWNIGDELFGYYECAQGYEYARCVQDESEVVARWNVSMKPIMEMVRDEATGATAKLEQMFILE